MALTARDKGGGDYEPIPEDLHLAICYGAFDLGTQHSDKFDSDARKIVIIWEIPGVRGDFEKGGKKVNLPRAISKTYTLSLHKKANLRKDLESWRGKKFTDEEVDKGFDIKKLLGAPCQLQVLHTVKDGKTYANVSTVIKAPPNTKKNPENPLTYFSFEEDMPIPGNTPEWIKKMIEASDEYNGNDAQHIPPDENTSEESVPF